MISCLPWKHNSRHEAGDEVLLSEEPPTPSMTPEVTPLPPRSTEDPKLKDVRQFYVKPYDLDPTDGGIGYTDGCKGCRSIVYGTEPRQAHSNKCRHRVIESAATNADVAARVTRAIDRDVKYHAKKLEATETGKRGLEVEEASEERKAKEPRTPKESVVEDAQEPFVENESYAEQFVSSSIKFEGKDQVRDEENRGYGQGWECHRVRAWRHSLDT